MNGLLDVYGLSGGGETCICTSVEIAFGCELSMSDFAASQLWSLFSIVAISFER